MERRWSVQRVEGGEEVQEVGPEAVRKSAAEVVERIGEGRIAEEEASIAAGMEVAQVQDRTEVPEVRSNLAGNPAEPALR